MAVGFVHGSTAAASFLVIQSKAKPCGEDKSSDVTLGVTVSIKAVIALLRSTALHALKGAVVGGWLLAGATAGGVGGVVGATIAAVGPEVVGAATGAAFGAAAGAAVCAAFGAAAGEAGAWFVAGATAEGVAVVGIRVFLDLPIDAGAGT